MSGWTQHGETNWRITIGPVEISIGGMEATFIFHVWICGASIGKGRAPTLDDAKAGAWDLASRHAQSILGACAGVAVAPLHPVDFYQAAMLTNARIDIHYDTHTFLARRADGREYRVTPDPDAPRLPAPFATIDDVTQWVEGLP